MKGLSFAALCALVLIMVFGFAAQAWAGDDDWQEVSSGPSESSPQPQAAIPDSSQRVRAIPAKGGAAAALDACGERAVVATPEITAIVAEINRVWHSNVRVYQSVGMEGPHAKPGGCIFYNPDVMASLLNGWMNIKEARAMSPMLYAIFAHEVGHEVHGDFGSRREGVSPEERELEADRFAGYTMSYLRIQPDDITTYYRLTGDDFTGGHASHGTSEQRANAFEHGWKLAEAGSSEQSFIPAGGLGHP